MSLEIIQKYAIRAKKALGQNFLVDEDITRKISEGIDIMWSDIVEVGPGYWVLTEQLLAKKPHSLHLVELDKDMIEILESRISEGELQSEGIDFQLHKQDVLEHTPIFQEYHVIANIPYYITSPILRHFLYDIDNTPKSMLILMQQDVGDRILQKHKNKSSVLSLIVQKKCIVTERLLVPKESFIPIPKVESSVLLFETHNDYQEIDDAVFLRLIKLWFSQARKKLIKNLINWWCDAGKIQPFFEKNKLSENIRAEDLDIEKWCELSTRI